uniref:Uncharacterized protein n=1 Tax=Arundo donax TaxID=35708 RepID=A0A0A9G4I7_ARUDO
MMTLRVCHQGRTMHHSFTVGLSRPALAGV